MHTALLSLASQTSQLEVHPGIQVLSDKIEPSLHSVQAISYTCKLLSIAKSSNLCEPN